MPAMLMLSTSSVLSIAATSGGSGTSYTEETRVATW